MNAERAQALVEMLELAGFLAANPDVPFRVSDINSYCISGGDDEAGMAELRRIAKALDVEITSNDDGTHWYAERHFGAASYQAYYILRDRMAEYDAGQKLVADVRAGRKKAVDVTQVDGQPAETPAGDAE